MSQHIVAAMILRNIPCKDETATGVHRPAGASSASDQSSHERGTAGQRIELAERVLGYYAAHQWDQTRLSGALRMAFRHACEFERFRLLEESIGLVMAENRPLRHTLCAYCALVVDRSLQERLTASHVAGFAWGLEGLMLLRPRPTSRALRSLERDVKALISEGTTAAELNVFQRLVLTDGQAFPQDAQIDLDLFGELAAAFRELRSSQPTAEDLQLIADAVDEQRALGQSALAVVRTIANLKVTAGIPPTTGLSLIAQYTTVVRRFQELTSPGQVPTFRRLLDQLIRTAGNSEIIAVFADGANLLARERKLQQLAAWHNQCEKACNWITRPQLLKNVSRAVGEGQISTSAELIYALDRACAHGALESLQHANHVAAVESASSAFHEFTSASLGDLAAVAQAEQTLQEWQRVAEHRDRFAADRVRLVAPEPRDEWPGNVSSPLAVTQANLRTFLRFQDKFFGFTAFRYAAQRTPTRGAAELVRFGNDVGRVSYLNARDITGFPGRGFFVRGIRLAKVFVADSAGAAEGLDPYRWYHQAWPGLAAEFSDLEQAEFLFARGMIVVSCRTPEKYQLTFPDGSHQQMSLVIFNDHFHNLLSREAWLVPTTLLQSRLWQSFVGYDDFTGFQPQRPDANVTIGSIQQLLSDPRYGQYIVSVGDPNALRAGFPQFHDSTGFQVDESMWARFTSLVQSFNNRLRKWENRGHYYHASSSGLRENWLLTNASAELAHHAVKLARDDRDRMYRALARRREVERPIWQLAEQHLNLFDLLLISLAAWHKGFTQGEVVSRHAQSASEDFMPEEPSVTADRLVVGNDEDVYWNQNSIRMLALAYEWHSQRRQGVEDRRQYPILTVTDTLRLGHVDVPQCWLDTYDMVAHLGNRNLNLSLHAMNSDDEYFWHTQFMPQVADVPGKLRDLRFYPRDSLGIGLEGN